MTYLIISFCLLVSVVESVLPNVSAVSSLTTRHGRIGDVGILFLIISNVRLWCKVFSICCDWERLKFLGGS